MTVKTHVGDDGRLTLDIPADLPPGPTEVVIVINTPPVRRRSITELRGLGAEIWEGIDAQEYVNALRDEWER